MSYIDDINNNIISKRWEERYEKLSDEIKKRLAKLDFIDSSDYQLQVIKRKRIYPESGDVFIVKTKEDIILQGVVVNNHIDNINGKDLLVVIILKKDVIAKEVLNRGIKFEDLIIPPILVGKEYWTKGYFYNISNFETVDNIDYGFYNIGKKKIIDEYGNELLKEPQLLGTYGVATISGVAYEITQELIIGGIL